MSEALLNLEAPLRLGAFVGILALMALWELASPQRRHEIPRLIRWSNNLAMVAIDTLVVRLVFPVLAVGLASLGMQNGWGLSHLFDWPYWLIAVIAFVLLDLAIYLQHVLFHAVPALWRLHRMHHADLEFDVTTGVRFHPLEILLSMLIKFAVIVAIGAPPEAVLLFEVVLSATSLFNHGNIRLPAPVDRVLRWFIVTPDMHRVHHSVIPEETNSNYGFNLPWWDRLLGTYRAAPKGGQRGMTIGLERFRTRRDLWLDKLLLQPFRGDRD
ncbi:MAG: sterol desaturase family protein [Yoonia sp.]|uniref:sterol desaturase family protein n=1 Tax=Yoonia sp. TaxID=2212373 RepID=UPI003EF5DB50